MTIDPEHRTARHPQTARLALPLLLLAGAAVFTIGITWGLPSRAVDPFLFGDRPVWSGDKILRLAGDWRDDPGRGADVDVDPLAAATRPVMLNATDEQRAQIIRRYRLYTYQPDEMITMRALSCLRPAEGRLDPRLYQYGGLWIYPVGALLKLASIPGLVTLRTDVAWYLDHPEEFGRFYVVARAYSAAWGLVGLCAVFWITRRLSSPWQKGTGSEPIPSNTIESAVLRGACPLFPRVVGGGAVLSAVFAGLCYTAMPVVINMAHEAKPHLPGAALQLLAIIAAMKYAEAGGRKWWLATAVLCGAAFGMVLSAWPVFIILPVAEWLRWRGASGSTRSVDPTRDRAHPSRDREGAVPIPSDQPLLDDPGSQEAAPLRPFAVLRSAVTRVALGSLLGVAVYLVANPYIAINLFANREVLKSNFGNSVAMYEIGRWPEGVVNAAHLIAEGASWAVALVGLVASVAALASKLVQQLTGQRAPRPPFGLLLAAPALLILVQFVALAAGKPGEYGRFAALPDVALLIASAVGIGQVLKRAVCLMPVLCLLLVCTAMPGYRYLMGFINDAGPGLSRLERAETLTRLNAEGARTLAVEAEPAPYSLPPLNLFAWRIVLLPRWRAFLAGDADAHARPLDGAAEADTPPPDGYQHADPKVIPSFCGISWADKPFAIWVRQRLTETAPFPRGERVTPF